MRIGGVYDCLRIKEPKMARPKKPHKKHKWRGQYDIPCLSLTEPILLVWNMIIHFQFIWKNLLREVRKNLTFFFSYSDSFIAIIYFSNKNVPVVLFQPWM